jgi:hypothetical protein
LSKTHRTKRRPVALTTAALTLALTACSANTATPPPSTVAITTTTATSPTTTTTSTSTTTTTTLNPKTLAAAAARTSWETFRESINACQAVYPDCDVEAVVVPYMTNPYKDQLVDSYAKLQADAKVAGAIIDRIELNSDVFEGIEFTNSDLTEVILTSCGIYGSREIIPATLTTPEIVIDDEPTVGRFRTTMALEPDGVWRIKATASPTVKFEGVQTCPPEG